MARDLKLTIGAVNITTHPHSPANYKNLLKAAFALKQGIPLMGQRHAVLGSVNSIDETDDSLPLFGEILCYTKIDSDGNWLNLSNFEILDDDEKKKKILLPKDLMPDSLAIQYVFFPNNHHLFFEVYHRGNRMRPRTMGKFLLGLLNSPSLEGRFGEVNVTVIPSHESLEQILSMPRISRLNISIRRPNSDDQDAVEKRVLKTMTDQCVIKMDAEYTSERGGSLKPDQLTMDLACVAAKNGVVEAHGLDANGNAAKESTSDHPLLETTWYSEKTQTFRQVLHDLAELMMGRIKRGKPE